MTRHDNTSCQLAVSTIKDVWTRYDKERTACPTEGPVALRVWHWTQSLKVWLLPGLFLSVPWLLAYFHNVVLPSFLLILSLFPLILPFFSRFAFLCRHLSRLGPLASAGCGRFLGPAEVDLKIVAEKFLGRLIWGTKSEHKQTDLYDTLW